MKTRMSTRRRAERLAHALGRTYRLAGLLVRVVRIDAVSVTFASLDARIRLVNASVSHDAFFQLDLEEV